MHQSLPDAAWLATHLPAWMRSAFLGVQAWRWLSIIVLIGVALAMRRIVVLIVSSYVRRLVGRLAPALNRSVEEAAAPIAGLMMALVFGLGFEHLGFAPAIERIVELAVRLLAVGSGVWLAYSQIGVLSDVLSRKAAKTDTKLDDQLVPLVRRTLKVIIAAIGGIFVLQNLNVDVASLVAGLGLGGLAFALAAKDTLANLFGSLVIFIDRPFQIDDWVNIDGVEGTVEDVGFRTTRIRTFYNSLVTVPNAKLTAASIDNMGARQYRRIKIMLGLTYSTTPEQMESFVAGLRRLVDEHPATRKDNYQIHFNNFGAYALEVLFYVFVAVPDWTAELAARQELFLSTMKLAAELGVDFAFPTQTVHIGSFAGADAMRGAGQS